MAALGGHLFDRGCNLAHHGAHQLFVFAFRHDADERLGARRADDQPAAIAQPVACILDDGGVFATNPAILAYAEANGRIDVLASLGTGEQTRRLPYDEVKDWGLVEWARPILDVVFDGISDAVDYQLRHALPEDAYWRLQTELVGASDDLDDASPDNLTALRSLGEALIAERSADLDAVIAKL